MLALGLVSGRAADASEPAVAAPAGAPRAGPTPGAVTSVDERTWQDGGGRWHRLYRPQFQPAADLFADAVSFGLAPVDLALDKLRSRLVLSSDAAALPAALEALAWLDVPTPEALVEIAIVECSRRDQREHGGHLLFDRGAPAGAPDTVFRSLRYDFEPDSWLRGQLAGERPFEGTSVNLGHSAADGWLAGTVGAVLRGLAHDGEAEFLTAPALVCTEGVPARVEATSTLPVSLFFRRSGPTPVIQTTGFQEKAGVVLEVLAERIGTDRLRLAIHPWVRQIQASSADGGPASYPVLAVRELHTTLELADGETVVVGGLEGLNRIRSRGGLPGLSRLPAVDSWLAAHSKGCESTDLLILVKAHILRPGRPRAPFAPPSEGARLRTPCAPAAGP